MADPDSDGPARRPAPSSDHDVRRLAMRRLLLLQQCRRIMIGAIVGLVVVPAANDVVGILLGGSPALDWITWAAMVILLLILMVAAIGWAVIRQPKLRPHPDT